MKKQELILNDGNLARNRSSLLPSRSYNSGEQLTQERGWSNPARSRLSGVLHKDIPAETLVNNQLQDGVALGHDLLIKQPWNSSKQVLGSLWQKCSQFMNNVVDNHADPNIVRMKKFGMLGASVLFIIFAAQSTFAWINNYFSGNKKGNTLIHLADAFMKWVMGIGIWYTALGTPGKSKFQGLHTILAGTGISMLLGQLNGFASGEKNILATASKLTGVDDTMRTSLENLSLAPKYVDR